MEKIGRYEIESEIGRGSMGVVYLAHDPRLRRRVAVKTYAFPQGLSEDQRGEFRERFLREAQAAAALTNPGIVTVYDADADPQRKVPYIAMEYVPGSTLGETLQAEGPFDLERVRNIVDVLTDGLQAAHTAGIVHRDIKPANLLVHESNGSIKIADFGVAKLSTSTLTQAGTSMGSPAYMSPEQIRGESLDGRSDLFSLAVVLYELLSGQRPFSGDDPTTLIYAVVNETPIAISKLMPGLPAGLDSFFERALAKDRTKRFFDGRHFRTAFEDACQKEVAVDVEATVRQDFREVVNDYPQKPHWFTRRRMMTVAAVMLLTLVGWGFFGSGEDTFLKLDAKSAIEFGMFRLLVDGEEVYQRELAGPGEKRGLLKKVLDRDLETFEAWIKVTPGKHEVIAQVDTPGGPTTYRDTIVVDLERGETRRLKLAAGRTFSSGFSLKAD